MKLHDLRPPAGAKSERTRAGRGISAGRGKTAGRGTKGQNSRTGSAVPAWSEGGQTPIHIRVPKLRGFKRRFRVEYEVVNIGRIAEYAELGRFTAAEEAGNAAARSGGRKLADAPLTVNAEILRQAQLIGNIRRPVKILGQGDVSRRLFVVADAFTKSAREKIEAAGGTAQILVIADARGSQRAPGARRPGAPEPQTGTTGPDTREPQTRTTEPDTREPQTGATGPDTRVPEPDTGATEAQTGAASAPES
jgi:large subunit ribosomal protein L15